MQMVTLSNHNRESITRLPTSHESANEYPVEKCCGFDRLYFWSTRLHAALFVLSIAFLVIYSLSTGGAFILLYVLNAPKLLRKAAVSFSIASTIRLVSSLFLLLGVVQRTNYWLLLYITGSLIGWLTYFVGSVTLNIILLMSDFIFLACDIIMIYILRRFMVENHLFTSMLAEKRRRYNRALRIQGNALSPDDDSEDSDDDDEDADAGSGSGSDPTIEKVEITTSPSVLAR